MRSSFKRHGGLSRLGLCRSRVRSFLPSFCTREVKLVAQRTRLPSIAGVHGLITHNIGSVDSQITGQSVDLQVEVLGNSEPTTEVTQFAGLQSEGSEMVAYGARL